MEEKLHCSHTSAALLRAHFGRTPSGTRRLHSSGHTLAAILAASRRSHWELRRAQPAPDPRQTELWMWGVDTHTARGSRHPACVWWIHTLCSGRTALYLRGAYLDTEELASYMRSMTAEHGHENCNESNNKYRKMTKQETGTGPGP